MRYMRQHCASRGILQVFWGIHNLPGADMVNVKSVAKKGHRRLVVASNVFFPEEKVSLYNASLLILLLLAHRHCLFLLLLLLGDICEG